MEIIITHLGGDVYMVSLNNERLGVFTKDKHNRFKVPNTRGRGFATAEEAASSIIISSMKFTWVEKFD